MPGETARDDAEAGAWEARRVLPRYNVRLAKIVGLCQIFCGLLMVLLGAVALVVQAFTSVGATGILTGVAVLRGHQMIMSGVVGRLTATRFAKEMWIVAFALVISVVSMTLDMALIGAGVTGLHKETARTHEVTSSVQLRQAMAVCEMVFGACGILITAFSVYLCCVALFYACCKVSSPVKYMVNYMTDKRQPNDNPTDSRNAVALDNMASQPELTQPDTPDNIRY